MYAILAKRINSGFQKEAVRFAMAIGFPLLFLFFYPGTYYNAPLDPYHYFALAINYADPSFMPGAYKLARLPWVFLGSIFYSTFSHMTGAILLLFLQLGFLLAGFYFTLRKTLGQIAAFIGTLAVGFSYLLVGTLRSNPMGGFLYHNYCGLMLYIWTIYLFFKFLVCSKEKNKSFFFTGLFFGLAASAQTVILNFFPLLLTPLIYKSSNYKFKWSSCCFIILGGISAIGVQMLINFLIRGEWCYFISMWNMLQSYFLNPSLEKSWWVSWKSMWFLNDTNQIFNISVFCGSMFALLKKRFWRHEKRNSNEYILFLFLVQYVLGYSILVFWQSCHHSILNIDFIGVPICIHAYLAFFVLIYLIFDNDKLKQFPWTKVVILTLVFMGVLFAFTTYIASKRLEFEKYGFHFSLLFLVFYTFFFVFIYSIKIKSIYNQIIVVLLIFLIPTLLFKPVAPFKDWLTTRRALLINNKLTLKSIEFLSNLTSYNSLSVWYDLAEAGNPLDYEIFSCIKGIGSLVANPWVANGSRLDDFHMHYSPTLPIQDLSNLAIQKIKSNNCLIAIVSRSDNNANKMQQEFIDRFQKEGINLKLYADVPFFQEGLGCRIKILQPVIEN